MRAEQLGYGMRITLDGETLIVRDVHDHGDGRVEIIADRVDPVERRADRVVARRVDKLQQIKLLTRRMLLDELRVGDAVLHAGESTMLTRIGRSGHAGWRRVSLANCERLGHAPHHWTLSQRLNIPIEEKHS